MQNSIARLATFGDSWPQRKWRASSSQLAVSGFFFGADGDRIKCWYCNGGLHENGNTTIHGLNTKNGIQPVNSFLCEKTPGFT